MNIVGPRLTWLALTIALAACSEPATVDPTSLPSADTTENTGTTVAGPTTSHASTSSTSNQSTPLGVLVFHKTAGFRHDSIEAGIQAIEEMGGTEGYEITATEDASVFSSDGLQDFDVVVFLNTTGDVLDEDQQAAMEKSIRAGHGFVGVHSAADTEYDWEWYGSLVGAYFEDHPDPQSAATEITTSHPVVDGLSDQFERFDEWYNFRTQPPADAIVLATLDESTYEGGNMGQPHPIVWAQEYDGGRAVYIGFGHTPDSFSELSVRTVLDNAIRWAAGRAG